MARRKPPLLDGPLSERTTADGRRRIQLTNEERDEAANLRMIEAAVALYLDVTGRHANQQIANELGISIHQLKNLTCTEAFERCWNENVMEIAHDPRLKATKNALLDLLPLSLVAVKDVLENGTAGAKVQAARMVFDLNGIVKQVSTESDRKELIDFLTDKNLTLQQNNVNVNIVPDEYSEAMDSYDRAVEGEFREVNDSDVGIVL